jgi:glycosyl transferase family 1
VKVYVLPADDWGCGSYRLIWPAQAAAEVEHSLDVTILPPGSRNLGGKFDPDTGRVLNIDKYPQDADVFVLQRPTSYFQPQVIQMMMDRGIAVVVDMDDDLSHVHPSNPAFAQMAPKVVHPSHRHLPPVERHKTDGKVPNLHSHLNAVEACRLATMVTVTTEQLASSYGAHGRVRILPNRVPRAYLETPHEDSDLIGWGGSMHSHPHDLQQVGPSIAQLVSQGARFETVGNPAGVGRALGLREDPTSPGDVQFHEWMPSIARFGIGLAPLALTRFNHAKSWLKPLEYAAAGVPAVISPTADYLAWAGVAPGACEVARKPREWEGILKALVRDSGRRLEMSEAGRAAAARHAIEDHAWRWAEAWVEAVRLQRMKVTAGAG